MEKYSKIDQCPITGSKDKIMYFSLGDIPLVNNLNNTREESFNAERYPLWINYFKDSLISALECSVDGELMFSNYLYKSEVNIPYYNHCKEMYDYINRFVEIDEKTKIVDIGGNDWTLLQAFKDESNKNLDVLNIDPSKNLTKICKKKWIPAMVEFFNNDVAQKIDWKYDVVTSTNVFQHLKDIGSFAQGVEHMLTEDGIRVLEFPYRINSMKTNQFDQVYHEHMYYHSVTPLNMLMEKYGLKIINITEQDIHGWSMRLVMAKKTSENIPDETIGKFMEMEKDYPLDYHLNRWKNIQNHIDKSRDMIKGLKAQGKTIYGFGAAAKWCIYLNAMGLDHDDITCVIDDTDIKQNKFIPGTGIQVVSRDILKQKRPDYILVLAHNFAEYIIKSLHHEYQGQFIILIPEIRII